MIGGAQVSVRLRAFASDPAHPLLRGAIILTGLAHLLLPLLVLAEMDRLGRSGFILNDLRRSWAGYLAARVAGRLTTRNRLTRHDGPLSVRRSFTARELLAVAHAADDDDLEAGHDGLLGCAQMTCIGRRNRCRAMTSM